MRFDSLYFSLLYLRILCRIPALVRATEAFVREADLLLLGFAKRLDSLSKLGVCEAVQVVRSHVLDEFTSACVHCGSLRVGLEELGMWILQSAIFKVLVGLKDFFEVRFRDSALMSRQAAY